MRRPPRWHEIPRLYRLLMILFIAIDAAGLGIAAVGLRSWSHAGLSVLGSVIWLLFLYPFFARIPLQESLPRPKRSSSTARIVTGTVVLFLSGWAILGGVDEFVRGVELPDSIFDVILFEMFLTALGALLVWRGWQRRRGVTWETFPSFDMMPGPANVPSTHHPGEKRTYVAGVIAFFILGSAVLYSFNFDAGPIAFQSSGWLVMPAGLAAAAAILVANGRFMRKARICRRCGQHVPLGANPCPTCGRPFA